MTHWCPTCWRCYERIGASPIGAIIISGRECWTCYDGIRQLWRDAYYRPESVPTWMRAIARPWEAAA